MTANVSSKKNPRTRCRFPPTRTLENNSPMPTTHCPGSQFVPCSERAVAVGTLVVTVIDALVVFAVPFAAILAGAKVHVASEGRPEQARLMLPLNPLELETLTEVDPVPPGAEINTVCPNGIAAKNPGVMVNDCGCVDVLALKLASPL
jgi:hypothetical protein